MFHRRYSAPHSSQPAEPPAGPAVPAPGFTHHVQMQGTAESAQRERLEKLRQRQEETLRQQQLMETEQELDGILEEEKELARRREELQVLNDRQNGFHERRRALEDRIDKALKDFERECRHCERDERALEESLETCRRYLLELDQLAPGAIPALRNEVALQRQMEFLAGFERRLDRELSALAGPGGSSRSGSKTAEPGFGDSFRRGLRFFRLYLALGLVGLVVFLSLTGGGR